MTDAMFEQTVTRVLSRLGLIPLFKGSAGIHKTFMEVKGLLTSIPSIDAHLVREWAQRTFGELGPR